MTTNRNIKTLLLLTSGIHYCSPSQQSTLYLELYGLLKSFPSSWRSESSGGCRKVMNFLEHRIF